MRSSIFICALQTWTKGLSRRNIFHSLICQSVSGKIHAHIQHRDIFSPNFQNLLVYYDPAPILSRPLPNHIKTHTYVHTGLLGRMYIHENLRTEMHASEIHTCLLLQISMTQASDFRIERKQVLFLRLRVSGTESPADWMPAENSTELSRIKLKTGTQ